MGNGWIVVVAAVLIGSGCAGDPPSAVVAIAARGCGPTGEVGSGVVVEPGVVLTSAHVVAGADDIAVSRPGWSAPGAIVAFDDRNDLAYIRVEHLPGPPLDIDTSRLIDGDAGVAYVVRDGVPIALPVTVERSITIETEDIYRAGSTTRPGFELTAEIETGDSGAPVLVDGRIIGVVWARSTASAGRAYAIDAARGRDLIDEQLRSGIADDIDLTRCTS